MTHYIAHTVADIGGLVAGVPLLAAILAGAIAVLLWGILLTEMVASGESVDETLLGWAVAHTLVFLAFLLVYGILGGH